MTVADRHRWGFATQGCSGQTWRGWCRQRRCVIFCGCDDYSRTRSGGKCGEAHWCTGEASAVVQPAKVGESQRATPTGNEVTCHTVAASSLGRPSTVWLWGIIAHAPHQWPSQSMDAAWRLVRSSQPADPAQPSNCGIATARFGRVWTRSLYYHNMDGNWEALARRRRASRASDSADMGHVMNC